MTQLGFVAILIGLMVLSAAGGADRFADLARVSDGARTAVFSLTVAGFGSKAGLLPLHAAAARPPRGAESGVGFDERGDGQPGRLRHRRFDLQLLGPGRAGGR